MGPGIKHEHREGVDTALLLAAFVGGISLAIILKILGLPAWVPALAAGAVIIVYAVATYFSSVARLEPEQIGDNCYYLGFCITLASLAYTLYALGAADDDAAVLSDVISGFGVALSSTVVGVMARVVLLQFRVDLVAREKEARGQLNQAMRSFHAEMQSSITSTKETITQIRQSLDEHTSETIKNNKQMQESYEERIAALVEEAVTGVKAAMNEVVDSGKEMNRRLAASTRANISTAEKSIVNSMETISEDLKRASDRLEQEMQQANASSVATLNQMVSEVTAAMKRQSEEAEKSINSARHAQEGEMTKAVEAVAANVFEVAHQIEVRKDRLSEALEGFAQQAENALRELGTLANENAKSTLDIRETAQQVKSAALKVSDSIDRLTTASNQSTATTIVGRNVPAPSGQGSTRESEAVASITTPIPTSSSAVSQRLPTQQSTPKAPDTPNATPETLLPSSGIADGSSTSVPNSNKANDALSGGTPVGTEALKPSVLPNWFRGRK